MLRNAQKIEADHQMQQCLVILQRDVADFLDLFQAVEQSVAVDVQLFYSICRVEELFQISLQSCEKAGGILLVILLKGRNYRGNEAGSGQRF